MNIKTKIFTKCSFFLNQTNYTGFLNANVETFNATHKNRIFEMDITNDR